MSKMMSKLLMLMAMIVVPSFCKNLVLYKPHEVDGFYELYSILPYWKLTKNVKINEDMWDDIRAVGYTNETGSLWAIICTEDGYGRVPGQLDSNGNASFTYDGYVAKCTFYSTPLNGTLYFKEIKVPYECRRLGFQDNEKESYYSAVIHTKHGSIPGKASSNQSKAWYGWKGKEYYVTTGFQIICPTGLKFG